MYLIGLNVAHRTAEQDSEMMRLQVLGDPDLMAQLRVVWASDVNHFSLTGS
jgi:hypothetical protein